MSHPMWQPLGRLSYCAYIVHFFTLFWYLNINDSSMHFYSTFQVVSLRFLFLIWIKFKNSVYLLRGAGMPPVLHFRFLLELIIWNSDTEVGSIRHLAGQKLYYFRLKKMMIEAILQRNQRSELTQVETLVQESNAGSEEQLIRLWK